jgi:hypothetical protein
LFIDFKVLVLDFRELFLGFKVLLLDFRGLFLDFILIYPKVGAGLARIERFCLKSSTKPALTGILFPRNLLSFGFY